MIKKHKGYFKKGNTYGKLLKGIKRSKATKLLMGISKIGKKNSNWKGDKVSYAGVHAWIRRNKGKLIICIFCGSTKNLEWANKDHKYRRKKEDYISLCRSCHMKYDIKKGFRKYNLNKTKIYGNNNKGILCAM